MTRQADLKRRVRARMEKTGESYAAARVHVLAERQEREQRGSGAGDPAGALHVTNGDATVPGLLGTGLATDVLAWRDVLHEGPVPALADEQLRRVRAAFLAGEGADDLGTLAELEERDRALETHAGGAIVLWFEADLYDQLQLVQILDRLARPAADPARITLICIGEHLGFAHFGGLGELSAAQLRELPATAAAALSGAALDHATRAWAAFTAPDPAALGAIVATPSPELRFVGEAFDRLSREYPSTRDGLSVTERRILAAVNEGAATAEAAFIRIGAREPRPFLGDTWAFDRMRALAAADTPLLAASDGRVDRGTRLSLTDAGRRVLDGRADHVALNGVDRWIGGVHLTGRAVAWRWDEGREAVVPA